MTPKSLVQTLKNNPDKALDESLRPKKFQQFVGQNSIKENLQIIIEAAKQREEPCDHILFYGPTGLGKTTLAHLTASNFKGELKITSGATIEKAGDLAFLLSSLNPFDILFVDEIHRLKKQFIEILYPALEGRKLNIIVGKRTSTRTIKLDLPPFTFIAATTQAGLLPSPLRNRFGASFRLDFYTHQDIEKILEQSAKILNLNIDKQAIEMLAKASRFTPRVANRLLKRVRDFAQIKNITTINKNIVEESLKILEIDELGLELIDKNMLRILIEKYHGGPVGLKTLSVILGEEKEAIEELYEPYLIQINFLNRTSKGRIATPEAFKYLQQGFVNQ